jgi:CheY-like chemotaxis protein
MPNNVKVLLVDDNPMVLGMLRGALTPLANVVTTNDSADALLKAVDDPPDLLVSDPAGQQSGYHRKALPSRAGR